MTDIADDSTSPDRGTSPDAVTSPDDDALIARLRVIEDQPLETRAAAFAQIHDELQSALEGSDSPHANSPRPAASHANP